MPPTRLPGQKHFPPHSTIAKASFPLSSLLPSAMHHYINLLSMSPTPSRLVNAQRSLPRVRRAASLLLRLPPPS